MNITGKIVTVMPRESGDGKTGDKWYKQQVIVETGDKFKKKVAVSLWGALVLKNTFKPDMVVDFEFDVESREYNGKWYTEVKVWRINNDMVEGENGTGGSKDVQNVSADYDSDLPFARKINYNKYRIAK